MMANKKAILFDFFGVISSEVAPPWFEKHFNKEDAARLKAEVFVPCDLGIISEEESYERMEALSGEPKEQIKEDFSNLVKINYSLLDFIRRLKDSYRVYVISNASASFLRRVLEKYELYGYFDGVFISSEMKLAKPSPDYFTKVLSDIGILPQDAVMTDDNSANVEAARSLGIDGIVFKNTEDFTTKLYKIIG